MTPTIAILGALVAAFFYGPSGPFTTRLEAFPNITRAQAMAGKANGWFGKGLGPNLKIECMRSNAGPSATEAMFAGAIDMAYIGPNPAISGDLSSPGEALRVVAGAASGGASPVVRNDSGVNKPEDFHAKRVASPQLGHPQDVGLRPWLKAHGMTPTGKGGDVQVPPMAKADQLTLFVKKQLEAAWAPEPWATRLIREGNGRLFLDEHQLWPHRQFVVSNRVVSTKFLHEHPDLVKNWIPAQVDLTDWIRGHSSEATKLVKDQIQRQTGKSLPPAIINEAFGRFEITDDPIRSSAQSASEAGFLGKIMPDPSGLYDLSLLSQVLKEKGKEAIP